MNNTELFDNIQVFNNEYLIAIITLFAMSYASLGMVELPKWVRELFKNDIFKVVFLSLIAMIPAKKDPHVAILIAIVFVVTLNYLNQHEMKENFGLLESFKVVSKQAKRIPKKINPIKKYQHKSNKFIKA